MAFVADFDVEVEMTVKHGVGDMIGYDFRFILFERYGYLRNIDVGPSFPAGAMVVLAYCPN